MVSTTLVKAEGRRGCERKDGKTGGNPQVLVVEYSGLALNDPPITERGCD